MIIFDFKRDAFLRETIVYSPAPSTNKQSLLSNESNDCLLLRNL